MRVGSGEGLCPSPEKNVLLFFLQNYNVANRYVRNVNNVTIVNKIELLSTYEYICILVYPMHCTGMSNAFPIRTAKLHVSQSTLLRHVVLLHFEFEWGM